VTGSPDLLRAALDYVERGWFVVPLHSPAKGGCSCGRSDCASPGKHPRTAHGLKDASREPAKVREWWQRWPDANIGVLTGPESGIIVLDVDGEPGLRNPPPNLNGDATRTRLAAILRVIYGEPEPEVPPEIADLLKPWPCEHNKPIIEAFRRGQKAGK